MRAGTTQLRGTSREGHTANRRRGWIGKLRSTTTQRAEGTARLITTIAVIVALIGGAGPAAAQVLVTNLSEPSAGGEALGEYDFAQPFTTGPNASGYQLESISLNFRTGRSREHEPVYVYLYGDHGNGRPNDRDQLATLTKNGATFEGPVTGVNKYTVRKYGRPAPFNASSVHLDANTQYWVFVWAGEDDTRVKVDDTGFQDTGAPGWSIGDAGLLKPEGSADSNYTQTFTAMKIQVEGTTNPEVLISISDATATEGPDVTADFVVTLNRSSSGTVTVTYSTQNVTAIGGQDYENTNGTLTFQPGETSKIISIPIIDDAVNDNGETFEVFLFSPTGADIAGSGEGTGTIFNTEVLTGSFENVPAEHDGSTPFTFDAVFNSDIGISYKTLRDHSFTVTNGKVTRARRNNGRNDSWEITVTPWGNDAVTVTLPGNRDCGTTAAICTKEDHPVQLSNSPSATVAGPPGVSTVPVTASFGNMPAEHDGSTFTFDLSFSENVAAGYARIRDHAFSVNGATIRKAQRKTQGSNQNWTVTVDPTGNGRVSITLPETTNCNNAGAICTDDGRKLNHSTSDSVQGPVGISVSDARVEEAAGAVLAFAVTLSRSASSPITINYATSDGSATAGADYTAASGILTIESGSSSGSIEVTVLDDSHNDGEETLTLTLSNASSGVLTDATATGTIENHDAMPRALIARFGRTAAVHIVEQVEERVNAPRRPGFDGRVAGREINGKMGREFALDFLQQIGGQAGYGTPMPGTAGQQTRQRGAGGSGLGGTPLNTPGGGMNPAMGGLHSGGMEQMHGDQAGQYGMGIGFQRDRVLSGSEFALNRATSRGGILSFWSRSAQSQFHGRDGVMALNGDVRTTMVGADYSKGRMVTGVSLSHSRGLGNYASVDSGRMTSAVTGLYPWIGYKASDRITVWTVAGYGAGGLLLNPGAGPAIETGLSMAMAAGGGRGQILGDGNGFGLAFKADALWVGTHTKAVDGPGGRLAATDAAVNRLRTALEGSHTLTIGTRMALTPSVEVGIRQDGGDADTGTGMDVGAGLVFADAVTGLSVDVRVRRLVVHQADGFAEHGLSISVSYNPTPTTPLGFTARVSPAWGGDAMSGAEALWGRESMGGMGHESVRGSGGNRLDTEVGYGLPIGRRFVGTPRAGVRTSEYGRDYRIGYGMQVLDQGRLNLDLGVDAERRESAIFHMQEQSGTDQRVLGRATVQW